jgi:hypothetical protein
MELKLPIFHQLTRYKNLLITRMGGGFIVFCGLPIYFKLGKQRINAYLANTGFSDKVIAKAERISRRAATTKIPL